MIASAAAASQGRAAGRCRRRERWWQARPLVFAAMACSTAMGAPPPEPPVSLERYRCTICHADREARAGPAFADVAAKYAEDRQAVGKIARDIRRGVRTGAPWHMPPHPEVSPAEARTMARYIMSLSAAAPERDVVNAR
jgi:cytochrome c